MKDLPPLPRWLDEICDRFEAAWKEALAGASWPCLEKFLADIAEPHRQALLVWLLGVEIAYRRQLGENPSLEEFQKRFPELSLKRLAHELDSNGEVTLTDGMTLPYGKSWTADGPLPDQVAGYEILGEVGRGGMGVVYRAQHLRLKRIVALKMILAGSHAGSEQRLRFLAEAEAVAALQHPNIVQVFDYGSHDDLPYLALEFVNGGNLLTRLRDGLPRPREAAWLVEQLARGMAEAHSKHIVHRDLKPHNVLLAAPEGIEPARAALTRCTPKVTDFGLAKRVEGDSGLTPTGAILGTPSYMAPEQADGKKEIGPAVDIYALGAILYECLTGRPPFLGPTPMDTIRQVVGDEPVTVRQLQPNCPRDLETICHKCLQKEPDRRYATALDLAEDLVRFEKGMPVDARPVGILERGWRWSRRNAMVAGLMATVAQTLFLGTGVATFFAWRANQNADQANRNADQAKEELRRAEWEAYLNQITLAHMEWQHGSAGAAWNHLERCPLHLRGWEYDYLATQFNKIPTFQGHRHKVHSVAFSPDDQRIVSGSLDHTVKVWDVDKGIVLLDLKGHTEGVPSTAISADGKRIVSGSVDKTVKVWDARNGTVIRTLKGHTREVNSVSFSPDGKRIVSASGLWVNSEEPGEIKVWDADKGTEVFCLSGHKGIVFSVSFGPNGKRIVSASADNTVRLWDAEKGTEIRTLEGHTDWVRSVIFSPDGKRIVSGSNDNTVKVWNADKGTEILTLKGHTSSVLGVAFRPGGRHIASASYDTTVKVWDADKGTEILTLKGHRQPVIAVSYSRDGNRIVSAGGVWGVNGRPQDGELKVWDANRGTESTTFKAHIKPVTSVMYSPDGNRIVSGSEDKTVKVWDADRTCEILSFNDHTQPVRSVSYRPDGKRIVSAAGYFGEEAKNHPKKGEVKVWDAETSRVILSLLGHSDTVTSVAFSPDGKRIVTGSQDRTVKVWDADSGREVWNLLGHTTWVRCVAFSPDGKKIVSGSWDKTVRVWDAEKGIEIFTLRKHNWAVCSVAFSADGKRIVSGSDDRTVKIWDADTGTEMLSLDGHIGAATSVKFSPDGNRIVSGSDGGDNTVRVWDPTTGTQTLVFARQPKAINSVGFRPDGKCIVSGSDDGTVRVWDADKGLAQAP